MANGLLDLSQNVVIRPSTDADVPAMLAIYQHHITRGVEDLGDYEPDPFSADDLKRRRKTMRRKRLPHLVADLDGVIAGYVYAVPFRKRPAYRYTVKHSIYVHPDYLNAGIGRRLLPTLIEACAAAGYRQMIGYIDGANEASLRLHESCGFRRVGLLPAVAFKFGHWSDSVMVQCALGEGDATTPVAWVKSRDEAAGPLDPAK
ncbi:MAG: N-acetyltransferase family protein [Roseiarcus sp.]